ncbi:hypothetical protein BS50DRAFT_628590 [Corynespora cassiicola Philippines]|uniref:Rhodopsin domain-containing protein n=1 Tax=Corynespora cassiicola Philippines TaxID=1448308 RepID=A0A2T2PCL0_CORCC|nr:hypothetical protein BS50DRAFT_628590 [Corynespora cassiicola Philippines]
MSYCTPSTSIWIYAIFTGVAMFLTGLRFLDDLFIIIGVLISCICTGIQVYNALHGSAGNAVSHDTAEMQVLIARKVDYTMIVIEKPAFGAIKLSLLFLYRRICGAWPSFRQTNNALIILVLMWTVSYILADFFICGIHIHLNWSIDGMKSREMCGDKGALLVSFAASSVVTDLMVLALPLFYIQRLHIQRGEKIGASFIFLLGTISTLAGVVRFAFLCIAYPLGRLDWGYVAPPRRDIPFILQMFNPTFWVMVELLTGAWAANFPALAPLIKWMNARIKGTNLYRSLNGSTSDVDISRPKRVQQLGNLSLH